MKTCFFCVVVDHYIEAAGESDDKFFIVPVGMAAPELSARNIVNPVSALHGEGNVAQLFHEREIAPMVAYFWQINDFASVCIHILCSTLRLS